MMIGSRALMTTTIRIASSAILLLSCHAAHTQAVPPTPEQVEMLQSLPPEERQTLIDQAVESRTGTAPLTSIGDQVKQKEGAVAQQRMDFREPPKLHAGDLVLLEIELRRTKLAADDAALRDHMLEQQTYDLWHRGNPYQLDPKGQLVLDGIAPILLADLTVDQALKRLEADPALEPFKIKLTLLPPQGIRALKPFGYEIFRKPGANFEPEAAIPVPSDYVLGPGDRLEVQLYGNERGNYVLAVGRDGQVRFPKLGPVSVGGMSFESVRALIEKRVASQLVGTQVSVSMGELRSIRVFVVGDVQQPGSYLVSALSTISNALLAAGGITEAGSLRDIELKRNGAVVTHFDAYDLLLNGDTARDQRLLPGEVVFVPSIGPTAAVLGAVRRPAIYELKSDSTVSDLLFVSGGLKPEADPSYARIERIGESGERVTLDIDLRSRDAHQMRLVTGDLLTVLPVRPGLFESVELQGAVQRPSAFQFRSGMRLSDVIASLDELKPDADARYILVRRENSPGQIQYLSADLRQALTAPLSTADLEMRPRDRVIVLGFGVDRLRTIEPALQEMRGQARVGSPTRIISVNGRVRSPGDYPLETGMKISDLLRAGGSPEDAAYPDEAELTRFDLVNGERRQTDIIKVNLARVLNGDPAADMQLQPYDVLTIQQVPGWSEMQFVTLEGEVRFPGRYPIRRSETLRSVLVRAGGLSDRAFAEGAVFTRESLRLREEEQIEKLTTRLQSDLAVLALRNLQSPEKAGESEQALTIGRTLLADLQSTKPVGRLVLNLRSVVNEKGADIEVRDGDKLVVPRAPQSVTVLGEVQSPTSHLWKRGLAREDYISMSGGLTAKADKRHVYVVRVDGSVVAAGRAGWFRRGGINMRPGDAIVAPLDAERMRQLPMWTSITQIIYNVAIAAAAVHSF